MAIWGMVAMAVGSYILNRMLAPRIPRQKAAEFDVPEANEGWMPPIVYGVAECVPEVIFVRHIIRHEDGDGFVEYLAQMAFWIAQATLDELVDLQFGGKSLALTPESKQNNPLNLLLPFGSAGAVPAITITDFLGASSLPHPRRWGDFVMHINAASIFGGREREGGVYGIAWMQFGNTGGMPEIEDATGIPFQWPGVATAIFGIDASGGIIRERNFSWGWNTPVPKTPVFVVGRWPAALLPTSGLDKSAAKIGAGANGAEMLYAAMATEEDGAHIPVAAIDVDSFEDAALQLSNEGIGLCARVAGSDFEDWLTDVLQHIDGQLYRHPLSGKWTLALARGGYDPDTLPVIDASVILDDSFEYEQDLSPQTVNEVRVKFRRFDGPTSQVNDYHILTTDLRFVGMAGFSFAQFELNGTNIQNLVVEYAAPGSNPWDDTAFTVLDPIHYKLKAVEGRLYIYNTATTTTGQIIRATYEHLPERIGFKDDVAISQDLGRRQELGYTNAENFDYPMYSTALAARWKAGRLLNQLSRQKKKFRFKVDRSGIIFTPASVAMLNLPHIGLENIVIRVLDVDWGDLENGEISIVAEDDAWGDLHPEFGLDTDTQVDDSGDVLTAYPLPALVMFDVLEGTGYRLVWEPGDEELDVEIEVNARTVQGQSTYHGATGDPFPGADRYADYLGTSTDVGYGPGWFPAGYTPLPVGYGASTRWFRGRHIGSVAKPSAVPGPWSPWVQGIVEDGDVTDPTAWPLPGAYPARPTLSTTVADDGSVSFSFTGDLNTRSIRYYVSTTGFDDGTLTSTGTIIAQRTGTVSTGVTLLAGETAYITAYAYSDAAATLGRSALASTQVTAGLMGGDVGAPGGVAGLDGDGYVPESQTNPRFIIDVYTVASQAAQLALTAQEGDVAVRTDLGKTFIHNGGTAGTMADWTKMVAVGSLEAKKRSLQVVIGSGSPFSPIAGTRLYGFVRVRGSGTLTAAYALGDQVGNLSVDVWKDTYGNFAPTVADSITGGNYLTISAAQKGQKSPLTGWTTAVNDGDILAIYVNSASGLTQATIVFDYELL